MQNMAESLRNEGAGAKLQVRGDANKLLTAPNSKGAQ